MPVTWLLSCFLLWQWESCGPPAFPQFEDKLNKGNTAFGILDEIPLEDRGPFYTWQVLSPNTLSIPLPLSCHNSFLTMMQWYKFQTIRKSFHTVNKWKRGLILNELRPPGFGPWPGGGLTPDQLKNWKSGSNKVCGKLALHWGVSMFPVGHTGGGGRVSVVAETLLKLMIDEFGESVQTGGCYCHEWLLLWWGGEIHTQWKIMNTFFSTQ